MRLFASQNNEDAYFIKSDVLGTDSFDVPIGPRRSTGILVAQLVASNDERYKTYAYAITGPGNVTLTQLHAAGFFDADFTLTGGVDKVTVSVTNSTNPGVFRLETWST